MDAPERPPAQGCASRHQAPMAPSESKNPSFCRNHFFQEGTSQEHEAGSALPGPPACQQAGITELQLMSLRDDRAVTLIFSAASTPVSYLCAGMIGIHYRPPPAARLAPQGGICKLSPSLNGIRLSGGAETGAATNLGSLSASSSAPLVLARIHGARQRLQGRVSSCPRHLCTRGGLSRHGRELPGQGRALRVRIGHRRCVVKMLDLGASNLPLHFGQASLPWSSTPSTVTRINLALILPQKAAAAGLQELSTASLRPAEPLLCEEGRRATNCCGPGNPQATPVTAQNA